MKKKLFYIGCFIFLISCNRTEIKTEEQVGPDLSGHLIATLETAVAEVSSIDNEISLNGTVTVNENNTAGVFSLVSGKITKVFVEQGDYVPKSKALALIESAETSEAASLISHKENQVKIARKNLDLKEELATQNLATSQEVAEAEFEYKTAISELEHAKRVGALRGGKNGVYTVKSPISGYVINKNIYAGSELREDRDDALFTISNLSEVWVIANVFEHDIAYIKEGAPVVITTLSSKNEWTGKIDKIHKILDEENRTMRVRINVKNKEQELMPGMFASVKVKAKPFSPSIVIPSDAVLLNDSKHYTIVKVNDSTIEPRQIEVLRRVNGKSLVNGLEQGQEVVLTTPLLFFEALTKN